MADEQPGKDKWLPLEANPEVSETTVDQMRIHVIIIF